MNFKNAYRSRIAVSQAGSNRFSSTSHVSMGQYSEYTDEYETYWVEFTALFNNRRKREARSPTQLYNILSIEIGLSASTLASFYRHRKSPRRTSIDKIIEWVEKEGNKKSVSFSDSSSSNNSSSSGSVRGSIGGVLLESALAGGQQALKSKESGILQNACEQRFEAHLLASISSATVTLNGMTQVNYKQAAEILAKLRPPHEVDYDPSSSKDGYTSDSDSSSPEDDYRQEKSNDERMPSLEVDYDPSSSKDGYTSDSDSSSPEDNYITDSDSGKTSRVSIAMKDEINCIYRKMETRSKWRLSTGKYVEDALFDFGMAAEYEHLAHSFIIDPDDETYNSIFTEEELDEIRTYNSKELPKVPDDLLEYLLKYDEDSLEELREVLTEKESWEGRNYDKSIHFNFEWIKRSMHNLINEYENGNLKSGRHENWYLVHFWNLIDNSLSDLDNVYSARGEVSSHASANRKNRHRTPQGITPLERKKLGRKGDLIIRKNKREYGCSEAGRYFKGINDTKILKERGLKCPKMLKDMFVDLGNAVRWEAETVRQMEVIGWIHAELMMMLIRLDSPSGYICRITRTPFYQIAEEVGQFGENLECFTLALKAKAIIKKTISLVEGKKTSKTKSERKRKLQEVGKGSAVTANAQIYDCCNSPIKKKMKTEKIL
ncbi:hypothetical protein C1646_776959 [Rhizophagus diaphanus]|nr:hypothetical protein C1646_776959 [Rhizophagus diaphanus] [Rhizophagus sp. MUCL 43196]